MDLARHRVLLTPTTLRTMQRAFAEALVLVPTVPRPNQGLPLMSRFRPQSPAIHSCVERWSVRWVGSPHEGRKEGGTHLWASGVTHPKESTPVHRTQEGQTSFHDRDSRQRGHLHLQPEAGSGSPSCPSPAAANLPCLKSAKTLCVGFLPDQMSPLLTPWSSCHYGCPSLWTYLWRPYWQKTPQLLNYIPPPRIITPSWAWFLAPSGLCA